MSRSFRVFLVVAALLFGSSAGAAEKVDFQREIRPLLAAKCFAGHGRDAEHREGGLRLDEREAALAGGEGAWPRLGRLIIAGTLPVVVVGVLFADSIETTLRSPAVVAVALAIGAIGLLVAERSGSKQRGEASIGYGEALAIGTAQASALIPGISRSGATLTVAMLLGLRRDAAARFVFLLSLPAVLAAALKEGAEVAKVGLAGLPITLFAIGLVVSAVVGYVTVKYFIRYLAGHSLHVFAIYRLVLAAVTVAWLIARRG